jgi:hypothetical protein
METTQTQSALNNILELGSKYLGIPMEAPNDDNDGSDAVCNAFDFADALYWHCVNNYNGIGSLEYWIHCNLEYKPSILANGVSEDNSIINNFCDGIIEEFIGANRSELLAIAGY